MQADWTNPDPKIADFLGRHGRYGIPFNIVYGPGAPAGIVLPELLTTEAVTKPWTRPQSPDPAGDNSRTNTVLLCRLRAAAPGPILCGAHPPGEAERTRK